MDNMKDYFFSDVKFLKLDIPVPYEKMLQEAQYLKDRFTAHRKTEGKHKGWKSLSLYGLDEDKHESWQEYGFKNAAEAGQMFKWTRAADDCPTITEWLKTQFPCNRFGRVRLMLVEAGGWIAPHTDTSYRILENINIPLSNPKDCIWQWGDGETFNMIPGEAYAVNISYEHAIYNRSTEDRFHLIVARHDSTDQWKKLMESAAEKVGATWHYTRHEIAT